MLPRPHPLAPVPLPSVCHAGPKIRVPASVFPTLMPPPVFPAGFRHPPGGTRTCTGTPPAIERPVPPVRKGHQCPSIPTASSIFPATCHGTQPGESLRITPSTGPGNSPEYGATQMGAVKPPCGARSYAQFAPADVHVRRNRETFRSVAVLRPARRGSQQRSSKSSSTRTPNLSASTGTRSSTPWNMPKKSRSAGRRNGV